MKRNEEYIVGEKFCSVPFFFLYGGKVYELLRDLEIRERPRVMLYQKWRVLDLNVGATHDYWVEEHKPFQAGDF